MQNSSFIHERVLRLSRLSPASVFLALGSSPEGLDTKCLMQQRQKYASHTAAAQRRDSVFQHLRRAFITPFSVVLLLIAIISLATDLLLEDVPRSSGSTMLIILVMLIVSGTVRFVQELKAKKIADHLTDLIHTSVCVRRDGRWTDIPAADLVVGDVVRLRPGDRVPADVRMFDGAGCYVSQSVITGESKMHLKTSAPLAEEPKNIGDCRNILFTGSTVVGGSCRGIVLAVGGDTVYGNGPQNLAGRKTGFDRGANSIAWVLIKFMLLLIPLVFVVSGLSSGNWLTAFLFSLSVAVGLTPELLPMVITACMARGSVCMSQKKTVVKNINAMQGFGSMDVLCVDKTGTLTGDTIQLEYYMDILGSESLSVLQTAYLSSALRTGDESHLDQAITAAGKMPGHLALFAGLAAKCRKLDELPFDYQRKVSAMLLEHEEERFLVVKGDVDSVVSRCTGAMYRGQRLPCGEDKFASAHAIVDEMLDDGMKILAVAARRFEGSLLTPEDEKDLVLLGYLAFFDAPRQSAESAIEHLHQLHMDVKVLTGDNARVAVSICRRLHIPTENVLTGAQMARLTDNEAQLRIENTSVFAELTPHQKAQVISVLQSNGHCVGFLGDGMNDLPAEAQADVGISVDSACPAAKEAADVILLKKDLTVLEAGVLEGRRAFANMTKYIRITASSNFGNILAVVIASICLPFFPMTSIQLLLLNLLYDLLCLVLPWDHVDADLCAKPLEWSGNTLSRFMLFFGPISSLFDAVTFAFLYFLLCPALCGGAFMTLSPAGQAHFVALFQTGWFLESMWSQVLILHLLRTQHLPFLQSKPARPVLLVTLLGVTVFTFLTMTPVGEVLGMTRLPGSFFLFLLVTVGLYLLFVTLAKKAYIRRWRALL